MNAPLDPRTADRLAKLCGLFSSDHDGEALSAARKADRLLRDQGLRWQDIILTEDQAAVRRLDPVENQIEFALANINRLRQWERGFIYDINRCRHHLSAKQISKLNEIDAKLRGVQ
jgi:hypothetical protein